MSKPFAKVEEPAKEERFVLKGIEMPSVIEGHAMIKCEGGWSHVKIQLLRKGNKVILENSQPDMKAIAFEAFKIAQVKTMNKIEG